MSRIISVCDAEPIVEALSSDDSEDLSAMDYLSDSSDFSNFSDSSGSDSSSNSEGILFEFGFYVYFFALRE